METRLNGNQALSLQLLRASSQIPPRFLVPVIAMCSQLLLKSVSKLFENVEWSNSLLRHFKIQTLLKINCCMAAISFFVPRNIARCFHFSLEIELNALRFINYTIPRIRSTYVVATSHNFIKV